ncbi:MAG TPA: universal stress protein [Solirubrobacterales bacterium]|nr:universal stress protein [Solirubrobacterales bacterium]
MYRSIITGTDGTPTANRAMEKAIELARRFGSEIHLVNVARKAPALAAIDYEHGGAAVAAEYEEQQANWSRDSIAELEKRLLGEGLSVTGHAVQGDVADSFLEVADKVGADLIVVGSRGMRGAGRVLGSIPNTLSHKSPCDILIVRTDLPT